MDAAPLLTIVERGYARYVDTLRRFVDTDCGTYLPTGVNAIADACEERFRSGGWKVDRLRHVPAEGEPRLGDCVVGTLEGGVAPEDGGRRFLMAAHMDTVFPEGTVAERPFRIEDGLAFGPGVNDCKGGLVAGFHAVDALIEAGWDRFASITFVCNPDEEVGSPFSRPIIGERAAEADVALVLEAARANGAIVSARKGVAEGIVEVTGRAAHAGVEPEKGRSAIVAAARLVEGIQALNGRWDGVTVNPGVIAGGTRRNVVAERCTVEIDVRSPTAEGFERVRTGLTELVESVPEGVTATLAYGVGIPPMERTEAIARLVAEAMSVAAELGIEVTETATGGGSDGNTTAALGVPTLDGLGPVGGEPHSVAEWLDLTSVVPRVTMLAGLIARLAG